MKPLLLLQSPVYTRTPTMFLDFKLDPGASFSQPVPKGWSAFIYTLAGEGEFGWSSYDILPILDSSSS